MIYLFTLTPLVIITIYKIYKKYNKCNHFFHEKPTWCLFDWDSTIVNTHIVSQAVLNKVVEIMQINYKFDADMVIKINGLDFVKFFRDFFKERGDEALALYREVYKQEALNLQVMDGAFDLLKKIRSLNIKTGIISNKPYEILKEEVVKLEVSQYMNDFIGSGIVPEEKPNVAMFNLFCQRNNIDPSKEIIWFFGDSPIDIFFSKNSKTNGTIFLGLKKHIPSAVKELKLSKDKTIFFSEGSFSAITNLFKRFSV